MIALSLGGCGFRVAAGTGDAGGFDATVDSSDGPLPDSDQPDAALPWGTPALVGFLGDDPTATGDLLELIFNSSNDLWVVTRTNVSDSWGTPALITQLSTSFDETTPEITFDGLTMTFSSNRPGGQGGHDLWMSTRVSRNAAWQTPVVLADLSSTTGDSAATLSEDALMVAMVRTLGGNDLYIATRLTAALVFGPPQPLAELNTSGHEGSTMLSGDKLMLCFDSLRSGNGDIYCATRATPTSTFDTPMLMPFSDPAALDADVWLSPDKRVALWSSTRSGSFQIWQATR